MNMEFIITEEMKSIAAQSDDWHKRDLGSVDLDGKISDTTERLDRRKIKKMSCPFCSHKFNPYYYKTLKQGEWDWVWVGCDHKQPESKCEIPCPKCGEELHFIQYLGQ